MFITLEYYGNRFCLSYYGVSHSPCKIIFCLFVIVGAAASLEAVIDFSDAMIFSMLVPNMIGSFILLPRVKEERVRFLKAMNLEKK